MAHDALAGRSCSCQQIRARALCDCGVRRGPRRKLASGRSAALLAMELSLVGEPTIADVRYCTRIMALGKALTDHPRLSRPRLTGPHAQSVALYAHSGIRNPMRSCGVSCL
jgi:hypothetical protein